MSAPRKAVCTICSNNYLAFARTLMASLRPIHPDWEQHVLIVDEIRGLFDPAEEPFRVVEVAQLPLPERAKFLFRYTQLELNTAVKPWLLEWLFDQGYDQVIYMDPDIFVYDSLTEAEQALSAGHFMVLTPHLTGLLDDEFRPSDYDILQAGSFNLGFIALSRHRNLERFLDWWQEKLEFHCVVDTDRGLFVDQKWMDLAPGIFGDVAILRHEGYNVAYWNLKHRRVEKTGERFTVNGQRLVFFHFSGLDPLAPQRVSKHQDRFQLDNVGTARELIERYCDVVQRNGLETCRPWPYAFGQFRDKSRILDAMRAYYRGHKEVQADGGDDPFTLGCDYWNRPWGRPMPGGPLVTLAMRAVWESRRDLQHHFRDIDGANRYEFAASYVWMLADEVGIPDYYVAPVREALTGGKGATVRRAMARAKHTVLRVLRAVARRLPPRLKRRLKRLVAPGGQVVPVSPPFRPLGPSTNYAGFYDSSALELRSGGAWMGKVASVKLLDPAAGTLKVVGEYSRQLHRMASGNGKMALRVLLDGAPAGELWLSKTGRFEQMVSLSDSAQSERVLSLEASQCFVPAQLGVDDDRRILSVRISRLEFNGKPILDFSRGQPFAESASSRSRPEGMNIVGYLRAEMGVGQSARLCAGAAHATGIPYALCEVTVGCPARTNDRSVAHLVGGGNPHLVNVIHVNADQLAPVSGELGAEFFAGHYNVGFWHWELPVFPDRWLDSFMFLDEVWTPSRFVLDAVSAKSPVPVVRMPHAVTCDAPPGFTRQRLGLPQDKFLFLVMYDILSYQQRKNPEAAVEAFARAFPAAGAVGLVIKVMNTEAQAAELKALRERLRDVPGILFITATMSRQEVYALESLCDCFVSLHRSEGFGLGLAECMCLGKPVIGTNWSGNVDFMNHNNSCPVNYTLVRLEEDIGVYEKGQWWAEPDREHAAWYMRKLVEDAPYRRRLAAAGQEAIRTDFSPTAVGRMYRARLAAISRICAGRPLASSPRKG